jgi:S1-C subfamily serine protease
MSLHSRASRPAALTLLTVCAPAVFAQQAAPQGAQRAEQEAAQARQAEVQRVQAERGQDELDQDEIKRELAKARANMEAAAREVAQLSGQLVGPVVKGFVRRVPFGAQRPVLGIAIEDTELGARVNGVTPNGPGADAGLVVGDTIVAIDGAELTGPSAAGAKRQSPSQLVIGQMSNVKPGDEVELRVLRDGDYRNVKVEAREQRFDVFVNPGDGVIVNPGAGGIVRLPKLGTWPLWGHNAWGDLQLAELSPALGEYFGTSEGLLVVRAPKNTPIALQDGDVILEIGGRKPTSPEHAMRILGSFEPGETLRIGVMRHKKRETLEGKVPAESQQ